jgi:hypothetical protein
MSSTNPHLNADQLDRYRKRRLAPADLLAADDHLSCCDLCYDALDSDKDRAEMLGSAARTLCPVAPAGTPVAADASHIAAEELFDYTDGNLERERRDAIQAHLQDCRDCRMQATDLESVRLDILASPSRQFLPRPSQSMQPGTMKLWRGRPVQVGLRAAGTLALAILVAWGATLPLRSRIAQLKEENEAVRQRNAELEAQASSLKSREETIAELRREIEELSKTEPGSEAQAVSLTEPSGIVVIDKDGRVHGLQSFDASDSDAVKTAVLAGRVTTPAELAGLRDKRGRLMGAGKAPYGLVAPLATIVPEQRPVFRWQPVDRAASYIVSIYSDDGRVAAHSEPLTVTEWRPSANLERGRTYTWQVRATVDSSEVVLPPPAAPDGKFKILAASKVPEWDRARQTYAGSHLMQGIIYARLGLLDDAERQFRELTSANPGSEAPRKLLRDLKSLRPKE